MSKTIKNSYYQKLTFDKLIDAHYRARKNKTNKKEVLLFEMDLENNIINIMNDLKEGTYKLGKYREFTIYEPKERIIKCLPYKDRVVHQWYIYEFIKPYIIPRLINSTCACIDNRGTHYAVNLVQKYMKEKRKDNIDYYVLKLDIKKYFYNIDKDILYNIMKKYICDKYLLELTKIFIYDNEDKKGIPIGNYTSQYFANIYLNELDKYIKEELKIKYYVRYMDDFILLVDSKEESKELMEKIGLFLWSNLRLELNYKSRYYKNNLGINYCGYRIYNRYRLLRNNSKKRIKKKIKLWKRYLKEGKLDYKKVILSYNSWLGHIRHANTYRLGKIINKRISPIKEM